MELTKNALRQLFKRKRRALDADFRAKAALKVCTLWQRSPYHALNIGSYLATDVECPTASLHTLWWQQHRRIFIPLISAPGVFAELTPSSELRQTALGVAEPATGLTVSLAALDILLLPLLGIDRSGFRLGHGAGFYDQLLAYPVNRPLLIGLGFHAQLTQTLPHDPWDIPVDAFLSERGWLFFT